MCRMGGWIPVHKVVYDQNDRKGKTNLYSLFIMDVSLGNKSYIYHFGYGYSKKRCTSIANWFINRYLHRHKLTIDIVHRSLKKDDCYGFCDVVNYSRPRDFTIELHSGMNEVDYTKTLLHELVHLKQWVEGSLRLKSGKTHFRGMNVSDLDYMRQPHEFEAFTMQEILYKQYNKYVFDYKGKKVRDNNFVLDNRLPKHIL